MATTHVTTPNSATLTLPSGWTTINLNGILIAVCTGRRNAQVFSAPSGWSEVKPKTINSGLTQHVFWKRVTDAGESIQYQFSVTDAVNGWGVMAVNLGGLWQTGNFWTDDPVVSSGTGMTMDAEGLNMSANGTPIRIYSSGGTGVGTHTDHFDPSGGGANLLHAYSTGDGTDHAASITNTISQTSGAIGVATANQNINGQWITMTIPAGIGSSSSEISSSDSILFINGEQVEVEDSDSATLSESENNPNQSEPALTAIVNRSI